MIHIQEQKIQEQGATIDGLNTQLAEVLSSLAEKVVLLERDKDVLGSRVNASHRRVHTLRGDLTEQLEVMEQKLTFHEREIVRLESKVCQCGESSSGLVSFIYPALVIVRLIMVLGGGRVGRGRGSGSI